MRLDLSPQLRLDLRMKLAPQMIQSMEILQLPLLALQERIQQELMENPVLEARQTTDEPPQEVEPDRARSEADVPARAEEDFRNLDRLPDEWERYINDPLPSGHQVRRYAQERDRKLEAMMNTAAPGLSLQEFLEQQAGVLDLDDAVRVMAHHLIWNLDDNGYLRFSLDEILASMDGSAEHDLAERALALVQSLDPPGVGARDLRECLLLQLDRMGYPENGLVRLLIRDYLDDIEQNRLPHIARAVGVDLETVKDAIGAIAHLNPKPGATYANEPIPYVTPDVVVEATDRGYEVHLVDDWTPHLYISRGYRDLARRKDVDAKTREFVTSKIRSAKWLIDSIEQRRTTILAVARSIVKFQHGFLEHGISHLKPLKMQTVADDIGVHVSTVSRAITAKGSSDRTRSKGQQDDDRKQRFVDSKYIQTPRGIYPMKFFFTGGTLTDAGTVASWRAVKQRIQELVDGEDKANPKSDEEIASELRAEGFDVARRTVTKYRKTLRIPSSRRRKTF